MRSLILLAGLLGLLALATAASAEAGAVGERHLEAVNPTAALRDAAHRSTVRVTVWYPAAAGVEERSLDIGPPGRPEYAVGSAAPEAPFADARRRPVILFSHGFGGTPLIMGWFTTAMARQGYVVIAVTHPGNNAVDPMTLPGAILFWDRPGDLEAALDKVAADPVIGPHMDLDRVGVAGFSAGGFTALAAGGARVELKHFFDFCKAHPTDGVCRPQKELAFTQDEARSAYASPALAPETVHAGDDHAIHRVRAVFAMSPAIVQAFDPASLRAMRTPVAIILGEADVVAPPGTNGEVAARLIPHAQLKALPGVGHYDFLAACTPAAETALCKALQVPQGPTHAAAIEGALAFFDRTLRSP